jgi:CRP-like cAMP-binding protein
MAERLRELPQFASLSIDQLFRICESGRQVRHQPGQVLVQATRIPDKIEFLLDGRAASRTSSGEAVSLEPPVALGFQEVLENKPVTQAVRAVDTSVCMSLTVEECRTLLADNTEMVQGLFKTLCRGQGGKERLVVKGSLAGKPLPGAGGGLKPVEKVVILKTVPVFSGLSSEEAVNLASIAVEVPLSPESPLFGEAEPPAIYALLSGELCLESPGDEPPLRAIPPDMIGIYETLAGIPLERRARAVREGVALKVDREELFDMIAQRPELLRQILSALFRLRAVQKTGATA